MSWSRVATVLILVGGAVVAAALKERELAMALAGAAAGFAQSDRAVLPPTTKV